MHPLSVHPALPYFPPKLPEPVFFSHYVYPLYSGPHPSVEPLQKAVPQKTATSPVKESLSKKLWNRLTGKKSNKPQPAEAPLYFDAPLPPLMTPTLGEHLQARLRWEQRLRNPVLNDPTAFLSEELSYPMPPSIPTSLVHKKNPVQHPPQPEDLEAPPPAYHAIAQAHEIIPEDFGLNHHVEHEREAEHSAPPTYTEVVISDEPPHQTNVRPPVTHEEKPVAASPFAHKPLPSLPTEHAYPALLEKPLPLPPSFKPLPPLPIANKT